MMPVFVARASSRLQNLCEELNQAVSLSSQSSSCRVIAYTSIEGRNLAVFRDGSLLEYLSRKARLSKHLGWDDLERVLLDDAGR